MVKSGSMIINPEKIINCDQRVKNLVAWLQSVFPTDIFITSGYRTEAENQAVGGHSHSAHCLGLAVDVVVKDTSCIKVAAKVLDSQQVKGLGINPYPNFNYCHFDFRIAENIVFWTYNSKNITE
jgi:uncharacterized protein YcbK (DUF882 family)